MVLFSYRKKLDSEITGSEPLFSGLLFLTDNVFTLDLTATGIALHTNCTLPEREGWLKLC